MIFDKKRILISIIVPIYNEEENIQPLYDEVTSIMSRVDDKYDFELLFTDNHSTDRSFEIVGEIAHKDERVKIIRFSKNLGYQRSIFAGYKNASGSAVVQLDCDLQDPPEMILDFIRLWEEGYKVVYGIRRGRKENALMNWSRRLFYRLIDKISEDDLPHDAGDFRLVDKSLTDVMREMEDYQPYLRGAIASMGFEQIGVPYDREKRNRGVSKFNFGELIRLAMDGIFNHSVVPLRLATYTGIFVSFITFLALIGYALGRLVFGLEWPPGFATTTVLILLSLSLNAFFLGIIGEYLGRIYQQVKKRPLTIVEDEINIETAKKGVRSDIK